MVNYKPFLFLGEIFEVVGFVVERAFYLSEKLPVVITLSDGSYLTPSPLFVQAKKELQPV